MSLPSQSLPSVCCVLVNWNRYEDTLACLQSLAVQDYPALQTIVVDNGSTDDSVARFQQAFPQIHIIETRKNLGFPSGCNVGIRYGVAAGYDYIWLLNNDTVAPVDTCSKLVAQALATPSAGIIGSVLYYLHDPAIVQAWGGGNVDPFLGRTSHFRAPAPLGPGSYLTFASALVPRKVFEQIGILYEGFFMYWDDADLALRVARAGYTVTIAEDTAILHKEGGSSAPRSPLIDGFSTAAGLHFLRRHSPFPLFSMTFFIALKVISRILRGQFANARAILTGVANYRTQRHITFSDTL